MKLNSLLLDASETPEDESFLGSNPSMTHFVRKKHFVTIEIFVYVVGNPLGSTHQKIP